MAHPRLTRKIARSRMVQKRVISKRIIRRPYYRAYYSEKWGLCFYNQIKYPADAPIRFRSHRNKCYVGFDFERNRFMIGDGTRAKNRRWQYRIGWRKEYA
jgi:hypothetical protein